MAIPPPPTGFVLTGGSPPDDAVTPTAAEAAQIQQNRANPAQATPLRVDITGGAPAKALPAPPTGFVTSAAAASTEAPASTPQPAEPAQATLPQTSTGGALGRGLLSGVTMNWDDELEAGAVAAAKAIGNRLGIGNDPRSFDQIYGQVREHLQSLKDADEQQHWLANLAGNLAGGAATALVPIGAAGTLARGTNFLGRELGAVGIGSGLGAVSGAGQAAPGQRTEGAETGAVVGGGLGGAGAILAPALRSTGRTVAEHLRLTSPLDRASSGLAALESRAPQDVNALTTRADELRQLGVEPRLVDIVDEPGRGVLRNAASKNTPGRTAVTEAADDVYTNAQDRVSQQAGRISDQPGSSRQLANNLAADRGELMESQMAPIRDNPVPVTPEMAAILSTREGKRSLLSAESLMTDPADRASVRRLMGAVTELNKLDPRLPQRTRDQITAQIMQNAGLTVDMADKLSRALMGRASQNPGLERVANQFGQTIRRAARNASPEYDEALTNYEARSRVADAATGAGRFEDNSSLLKTPSDTFAETAQQSSTVRPTIREGDVETSIPSERQALAMRARQEVRDAAEKGPSEALAVANRIARADRVKSNAEFLLGKAKADQLRGAMSAEVKRVVNTRYIDPRSNSQTFSRLSDALGEGGIEELTAAAHLMTGGKTALIHAVGRWLQRAGLSHVDARRLSEMALDPSRTDEAIAYFQKRGNPPSAGRAIIGTVHSAIRNAVVTRNTP